MFFDKVRIMLGIRLQRVGRKNDSSFRVIVADSRLKPKTGNFVEILGSYDARKGSPLINTERAIYWISKGAQLSDTLRNLFITLKIISGKKVHVSGKKIQVPVVQQSTVNNKQVIENTPQAQTTEEVVLPVDTLVA